MTSHHRCGRALDTTTSRRAALLRGLSQLTRLLVLAGASTGCATIFSSSSQDIRISSNVEGATVMLDGEVIGETPLTFNLERDTFKTHELTLRDDKHGTRTVRIKKSLDTAALFNCTFILSWGTDALTGAMMEYSPESYFIEMTPTSGAISEANRQLMLFVVGSYSRLLIDISRGEGEYLRTAATIAGIDQSMLAKFATALRRRLPVMARAEYPNQVYEQIVAALGET
jgi:hypothetical protein